MERRVLIAAGVGVLGVALLFLPGTAGGAPRRRASRMVRVLALGATYVASLGNMAASRNTQAGLPVVTVNAYGMAYGAIGLALIAALRGTPVAFDPRWPYVLRCSTCRSQARRWRSGCIWRSSSGSARRVPLTQACCFRSWR